MKRVVCVVMLCPDAAPTRKGRPGPSRLWWTRPDPPGPGGTCPLTVRLQTNPISTLHYKYYKTQRKGHTQFQTKEIWGKLLRHEPAGPELTVCFCVEGAALTLTLQ